MNRLQLHCWWLPMVRIPGGDESRMVEAAYAARAVYDTDGDSAMSSISEDIDVFGGDLGGRLVIGGGLGGWELTRAWVNECEVLYEDLRSRAEENATYVLPPLCDCSLLTFTSALCSLLSDLSTSCLSACLSIALVAMSPAPRFDPYFRLDFGSLLDRQRTAYFTVGTVALPSPPRMPSSPTS
jgi:hypothetical protein